MTTATDEVEVLRAQLREARAGIERIAELFRELCESDGRRRALEAELEEPVDITDVEREAAREKLEAASDVELVEFLLTLHKVIEKQAPGYVHKLVQHEASMLAAVLERFAPVTFDEALTNLGYAGEVDVCVECGRPWTDEGERWKTEIVDEDRGEVATYCPECHEPEFGQEAE